MLIIVSLTGLFNYQSRQVSTAIDKKIIGTQYALIQHKLEDAVDRPRQITNLFLQYIQGEGNNIDKDALVPEMVYLTASAFKTMPAFQSLSWFAENGACIAVIRDNHSNQIYLQRTQRDNHHSLVKYSGLSPQTNIVKVNNAFNVADFPQFRRARQQTSGFWQRSLSTGSIIMSWNQPVYDKQGRFVGAIASGATPADMTAYLQSLLPDKSYALLLIDDNNRIVARTGSQQIWQQDRQLIEKLTSAPPSPTSFSLRAGEKTLLATAFSVQDSQHLLNWKAVLIAPQHAEMAEMNKQRLLLIFTTTLFIFILMLVLLMIISHFTGALKDVADKVRLGLMPWKKQTKRVFPEIASLDTALSNLCSIIPDTFELKRRKLEEDSETGFLTRSGLLNCESLYYHRNMLAMIHVNNYNSVKHVLGTAQARQFIHQFALRIRKMLPAGALCCRDREDLFIIAFDGIYAEKDVAWYSALIASVFRMSTSDMPGESHIFTGHIGMLIESLTPENISECLMNVSLALQHAQMQRSGMSKLFTVAMREEEVNNLRLHQALCDDLRSEGFHLVMQPIVAFESQRPCKEGECLVRWQSNVLGFVPPDKFISLAENTGMIVPLGKWIIETACRELAAFIARGAPRDFKLHVNISPIQLQQPDFAQHLLESIHACDLMNSNICLEITESVLLQDTWRIVEILAYLRRLGVCVAIDDFGSGYSSLSYLHSLPFDCLKIDRGFVSNVLDDKKNEAVIASVLMLARSFSVPLVAEGVETCEMAEKLQEMGCDLAQGYYYSRPKTFDSFEFTNGLFVVDPE
ncbi:GGDEF domain-containing protein [Klebsiella sp. 141153]|uniref:bifunctional diguanylate cyclase/phosphodiesterase n=1 Tax=Klebsiella TaxID=570 RepID=UPI0025A4A819|nr:MULTISPECIES: GGDEF domain-containing protein [Klebsiella]MDU9357030.1 GGDEF domain-containing protein [Klebsiella sp. 141153]